MTDQEKLQKLFDAALRAPEPNPQEPAAAPAPPVAPPAPLASGTGTVVAASQPTAAAVTRNTGLDDAASAELAALLDERHRRSRSRNRRNSLVTAAVLFGLAGGGYAWFVQSPQRVQALHDAMQDIRSVGDVKSIAAKYHQAFAKIQANSDRIGQASAALGSDPAKDDGKGPDLEGAMMGTAGKTTGERDRLLKEKFAAKPGSTAPPQ